MKRFKLHFNPYKVILWLLGITAVGGLSLMVISFILAIWGAEFDLAVFKVGLTSLLVAIVLAVVALGASALLDPDG